MLTYREMEEIKDLFLSSEECTIRLISSHHSVPDAIMRAGPGYAGIEMVIGSRPVYIISKESVITELTLIYEDYSYFIVANRTDKASKYCFHEWVDVGFRFTKHVCKKCDAEKT
jgi:hypothetical protein